LGKRRRFSARMRWSDHMNFVREFADLDRSVWPSWPAR
jgi:hypothetical protein